MPTLPWTTPAKTPTPTANGPALVMASRFELTTWRDVPAFLKAAVRIRRQMLGSPGVHGVSLIAQPLRRTFYTLSAWQDRDALNRAVAGQPHASTMTRFHSKMTAAVFAFWEAPADGGIRPGWPEAHRRLAEVERREEVR